MMKKTILLLCVLFLVGCGRANSEKGNALYRQYLSNDIPQGIKYIEAKDNKMLGTSSLVFESNRAVFDQLVEDYKRMDIQMVLVQAKDWLHQDVIDSTDVLALYKSEKINGKKREFYLFWLDHNQRVYFTTMSY